MKKAWLLGLILLLVAAMVQFPAAWLAPQVARATHERWRLAGVEGTVWHGRATLYADDRATGRWLPGRGLEWRLTWPQLVVGRVTAQIVFDDGGNARLSATIPGWSVEQLQASMPAAQLATLLPSALSDYGWSGSLDARSSAFGCNWSQKGCAGQIELFWKDAATTRLPGPPLGDYRLRLVGEGDALRFDLRTERGRLQIDGAGEFSERRMRFTGEASATGEDAARLETVLKAVGRTGSAPGRYRIDYQETRTSS